MKQVDFTADKGVNIEETWQLEWPMQGILLHVTVTIVTVSP